ncbi:MAG TPA: STAS/SEC14 domain-containing protein [Candidatus Saccharimonadales bacterium]|nr:STAS/SEC14 domain-containing protein [Candidatus Saccharimonadales bacterium]
MDVTKKFSAKIEGDFIHLKTWGELKTEDLHDPVDTAIELAKEKQITKLLDDIRDVDSANISIPVQAKGLGMLWKLQHFKKVAIIFRGDEMGWMLTSSLEAMHIEFSSKIKGFRDEQSAIKWLAGN